MGYQDRLRAMAKKRKAGDSGEVSRAAADAEPMFFVIAEGLDSLTHEVKESRLDVQAVNERIAAQEEKTHSAWHAINRVETRLNNLPRDIAESIERHENGCPGRDYVRHKIKSSTASQIPRFDDGDATRRIRLAAEQQDMASGGVPRWVIYVGSIIGAAVAASGYLLHMLGLLGS